MKIRVLGCSGAIAQDCRTTSFLVDQDILVDAGTGVGDLTLQEMLQVEDVLLTHSHLDHIAALPLMVDAIGSRRGRPLRILALPQTIEALRAHIFNNTIWPDFSRIPSADAPFICFEEIVTGQHLEIRGRHIEVLPAVHTVPAVGFAIAASADGARWVFSGDTGRNPAFWRRVNAMPVAALVIETAFSNREKELADLSRHLAPESLAQELELIAPGKAIPIYITHTKPAETDTIMQEIRLFDSSQPFGVHDIRWLSAGQEFEI